ncbi:hypothetical protein [Flavobacterium sp. KACC 22763]|uniref:hypothetical protein n=1 Tax=Flavobacterium sp. KACC 22763 TaxID=3025668 RepID=UPI0023658AC1|nr:hypothetical protein [Flavobacterium sp. KACC 22763]WDF64188.1 hypothetical protein PQ463_21520 [Flavobacterium sp. KACC 22763]
MKRIFGILLITLFSVSCDSNPFKEESIDGFSLDAFVDFSIVNSKNEDLLNPNNPDSYDRSKIKILFLLDGKLVPQYKGNLDYPNFFTIYQNSDRYVIRVFLNYDEGEKFPETYIQWNENEKDIVKVEYSRTKNSISKKNVWFNDQAITSPTYFTITK